MKIKITASHPRAGQEGIEHLIGEIHEVVSYFPEDKSYQIITAPFGSIWLNPREFEVWDALPKPRIYK